MMRRVTYYTLFSFILFFAVFSISAVYGDEEPPEWVYNPPAGETDYFIGIGNSENRQAARELALMELSSSISTTIESELVVNTVDTGDTLTEELKIRIRERVKQKLRGHELYDSFYSPKSGYWVYYRLSKEEFRKQRGELTDRVLDLLRSGDDPDYAVSERVSMYAKAWALINDSPWAGTLIAVLPNERGALIDVVEKRLSRLIGSLSIQVAPERVAVSPESGVALAVQISSSISSLTGRFQVVIYEENTGRKTVTFSTDQRGEFNGEVSFEGLDLGKHELAVTLDTERLSLHEALAYKLLLPEKRIIAELQQKAIGLTVEARNGEELSGIDGSVRSLLTDKLTYQITPDAGDNGPHLYTTIFFRQAPPNDYGLTIAYAKAQFTVKRGERVLASFETAECKDGGLDSYQAKTRAFAKLMDQLKTDNSLAEKIETAASYR
jgi:hypothetical protein